MHHDPKKLGGGKGLFGVQGSQPITEPNLKAGTEAEAVGEQFSGLLGLRSYTIQGHMRRSDTSYGELCLLKSIISQEIVPQTCLPLNLVEALFANEVLSFQMALTCVKLTRNFPLRRP